MHKKTDVSVKQGGTKYAFQPNILCDRTEWTD